MQSRVLQVDRGINTFQNFIGQTRIKNVLKMMIDSALANEKHLDHIIFSGKSGVGKTTLCKIIANESKRNIHYTQGYLLSTKADILILFNTIKENDIIFIDEIHSTSKLISEILYIAMEEYVIDVPIGPDGETKIIRMDLPKFTIIGATTKLEKLENPFFERFGYHGKLTNYSLSNIKEIIKKQVNKLSLKINNESLEIIARASNFIPRNVYKIVSRIEDFAISRELKIIKKTDIQELLKLIQIYKYGLKEIHIDYLKCLKTNFNEDWINVNSLASILNLKIESITSLIEPILISNFLIKKSSRGRIITNEGTKYLKNYYF